MKVLLSHMDIRALRVGYRIDAQAVAT